MSDSNKQSKGQTKKCPKCQENIQSGAKKCKHCGADLRNWFVRHKVWTGILAFIVLVIVISAVGGEEDKNNNSSDYSGAEQAQQKETTYQVGEVIPADQLEITITNAEERNQVGSGFIKEQPSEGATLVVVDWKYKNVSSEPLKSFSNPSIKLVDENGVEYEADLGKTSTYATEQDLDRKILSDLNPGITVRDADVFEVSKEAFSDGEWKLRVKFSGNSYIVEL